MRPLKSGPVLAACLAAFVSACATLEKPVAAPESPEGFYPLTTDLLGNVTVVARQHIYPELKSPVMEEFRFADHAHCVRYDGLFHVCKSIEKQNDNIRAMYAAEEKKHRFPALFKR